MSDSIHVTLAQRLNLSVADLQSMSLDDLGELQSIIAHNAALLEDQVAQKMQGEFKLDVTHPDGVYWVTVTHKKDRTLHVSARSMHPINGKIVESAYTLTVYISGDQYTSPSVQMDFAANTVAPNIQYVINTYERCNDEWVQVSKQAFDSVVNTIKTTYQEHNAHIKTVVDEVIAQVSDVAQLYKD